MSDEVKKNETSAANTPFVRYDEYWLQKARTLIDDSVALFTRRLNTLNKFLNYLAAGTFLGGITYTTYTQSPHLEVYVLAIIPFIFIAIAKYRVGVKGSEPAITDTNMRSPSEINQDYGELLKTISTQTKDATLWVAIATGFTLVCLPFAVFFQNRHAEVKTPDSYVNIQSDAHNVHIEGLLPKGEHVHVVLHGKNAKKETMAPYTTNIIKEDNGGISAVYSLKELELVLDSVQLKYQEGGKSHLYTYAQAKGGPTTSARAQTKPKKDPKKGEKKKDTTATKDTTAAKKPKK